MGKTEGAGNIEWSPFEETIKDLLGRRWTNEQIYNELRKKRGYKRSKSSLDKKIAKLRPQCEKFRQQNRWHSNSGSNAQTWSAPLVPNTYGQSSTQIDSPDDISVYHTAPAYSSCHSVIPAASSEAASMYTAPLTISSMDMHSSSHVLYDAPPASGNWPNQHLNSNSTTAVDPANSTAFDLLLLCEALLERAAAQDIETVSYIRHLGLVYDSKGLQYANRQAYETFMKISCRPVLIDRNLSFTRTKETLHGTHQPATMSALLPVLNDNFRNNQGVRDYELALLIYEDVLLKDHLFRAVQKKVQKEYPEITATILNSWGPAIRRENRRIVENMARRSSSRSLKSLSEYVSVVQHRIPSSVHPLWEIPEQYRGPLSSLIRSELLQILNRLDEAQNDSQPDEFTNFSRAEVSMLDVYPHSLERFFSGTA